MAGTEAFELYEEIKRNPKKAKELQKKLDDHMKKIDLTWRKLEGRPIGKQEKLQVLAQLYVEAKANNTIEIVKE